MFHVLAFVLSQLMLFDDRIRSGFQVFSNISNLSICYTSKFWIWNTSSISKGNLCELLFSCLECCATMIETGKTTQVLKNISICCLYVYVFFLSNHLRSAVRFCWTYWSGIRALHSTLSLLIISLGLLPQLKEFS